MEFQEYIFKWIWIFFIIIFLTFFQKFYYKMLFFLKENSFFEIIFAIIIRTGVILHEFSHMFFAFIAGNKILKVNLFAPSGWYVKYAYKNYIASIWEGMWKIKFWLLLFLNQIGIFLTSLGPLIVWIALNRFFRNYIAWANFDIWNLDYQSIVDSLDVWKITLIIFYIIFLPSFVLSWKDISHFIISKQNRFLATFIASLINTLIFIWFLFLFSYFFDYFVLFAVSFSVSFAVVTIFWMFFKICACKK